MSDLTSKKKWLKENIEKYNYGFGVAVTLILFLFLRDFFYNKLGNPAYFDSSIFINSFSSKRIILLGPVFTLFLLVYGWKKLSYDSFDSHRYLRYILFGFCLPLTWYFAFGEINFFHDQLYIGDRLIIVALNVLLLFHPAFMPFFVVFVMVYCGQFHNDLIAPYTINDMVMPVDVLIVISLFLFWQVFKKRKDLRVLLVSCLVVVGTYYLQAGWLKISMPSYISNVDIKLYYPGSFIAGWKFLGLSQSSIESYALNYANFINSQIVIVLFIELAAVFLFVERRVTRILLLLFASLHAVIVISAGVFFYKWIWFDLLLFVFVYLFEKNSDSKKVEVLHQDPKVRIGGMALIVIYLILFDPWGQHSYKAPLFETYAIIGQDEAGHEYYLSDDFFSPYDKIFAQSKFYDLSDDPKLTSPRGSNSSIELDKALNMVYSDYSSSGLDSLRVKYGRTPRNPENAKEVFSRFIKQFVKNKYAYVSQNGSSSLSSISLPRHIVYYKEEFLGIEKYAYQAELVNVKVSKVDYIFSDLGIKKISDKTILKIEI